MTRHAIPVALALFLGACASVPDSAGVRVPQSPLGMRQAQTRTFATGDLRLVLKAALNVLQDQGLRNLRRRMPRRHHHERRYCEGGQRKVH